MVIMSDMALSASTAAKATLYELFNNANPQQQTVSITWRSVEQFQLDNCISEGGIVIGDKVDSCGESDPTDDHSTTNDVHSEAASTEHNGQRRASDHEQDDRRKIAQLEIIHDNDAFDAAGPATVKPISTVTRKTSAVRAVCAGGTFSQFADVQIESPERSDPRLGTLLELRDLLKQNNNPQIKKFLRSNHWSSGHRIRAELWKEICHDNNVDAQALVYHDIVAAFKGKISVSPVFLTAPGVLLCDYQLNEQGHKALIQLLTAVEHVRPDFTYIPHKVYALMAKLVGPASDAEVISAFSQWNRWIFCDLPFSHLVIFFFSSISDDDDDVRIVDCFLFEGQKVLYRSAVAILVMWYKERVKEVHEKSGWSANYLASNISDFCKSIKATPKKLLKISLLISWIPTRYHLVTPQKLFSASEDGRSFTRLWTKIENFYPTVILIQTTWKQVIIGAYCSEAWEMRKKLSQLSYFGTGESFLFYFTPTPNVFPWVGLKRPVQKHGEELFQCATATSLIIGGGGNEGLSIRQTLERGTTNHCDTFDNPPLVPEKDFEIEALEVFSFSNENYEPVFEFVFVTVGTKMEIIQICLFIFLIGYCNVERNNFQSVEFSSTYGMWWHLLHSAIKFGRRTIVAYDVEEDYQKDDRHTVTVTVVGTESAIAEHNFSSIRKEFYTNTIDIKFSVTLHHNNDNDNDSDMQMGIFNLRTRRTNRSFIMHIYLLKILQHFLEQKMNLGDDKAALLKANRPSKSSATAVKSMLASHPADDEREGIPSHCIHHHLMQVLSLPTSFFLLNERISCHSNPEAISCAIKVCLFFNDHYTQVLCSYSVALFNAMSAHVTWSTIILLFYAIYDYANVQHFISTSINMVPKCNHFEFYISSSDRSLFLHICRTTIYFVVDASTVHRIKYPNNPVVILSITENKLVLIITIEVVLIEFLCNLSVGLFSKKQLLFIWHQYFPNVASQTEFTFIISMRKCLIHKVV
ncbi:TLD family protein [Trichinella spiralis]|uniref:TLD family protein n=1 Tax=Trichinella spiralis TaxID=6334 RepID=UPI0001EFBEFB|nr:TLD family protein [Trichinella spiralis]